MTTLAEHMPSWVPVKTTLPTVPLPLGGSRAPVTTDRLIIRALVPDDLQAMHEIRSQPEVMITNPQGRPDEDMEATRPKLNLFLPPNDATTYSFAICLKETGDMIGIGGCHRLQAIFGWPVVSYQIRREYWGKGLATEFLVGYLDLWSKLPRGDAEIRVDPRTLPSGAAGDEVPRVPEMVVSWTTADNIASMRVHEKGGFEKFLTWTEPDLRNPEVEVELVAYRYFSTKRSTN